LTTNFWCVIISVGIVKAKADGRKSI